MSVDTDTQFLSTIPNIIPDNPFIGMNNISYSIEHDQKNNTITVNDESETPSLLLDEEQFDFDFPNLASDNESEHDANNSRDRHETGTVDDEDEIFFGPVGHTEKCVAVAVSEVAKVIEKHRPLSPLTAAEMAELCLEACTIASRIQIAAGVNSQVSEEDDHNVACEPSGLVVEQNSETKNEPSGSSEVQLKMPSNCFDVQVKALPACELPRDSNGVVTFSATGQALPKPSKPSLQRRIAGAFGLTRPAAAKATLNHLPPKGNVNKTMKDLGHNAPETAAQVQQEVPMVRVELSKKRHCISATSNESLDAASDSASIASDTSESSGINPATGKRSLPQPKFMRNVPASKLPQIGSVRPLPADETGKSSQGSSQVMQPSTAVVAAPSLQRVGSLRLKEPSSRIQAPGGLQQSRLSKTTLVRSTSDCERLSAAVTGSSVAAPVDEKVSGLRPLAKPDMLAAGMSGLDKRKTLTAIRGLNFASAGPRQGPLKAVLSGSNTGSDSNNSMTTAGTSSVSRGVHPPVATSTPCKPGRSDGKLNSSLCTPSRSSMKPPTVPTGSTLKRRASCVVTPGRLNSSLNVSRSDLPVASDPPVANQVGVQGRDSGVEQRSAINVRRSPSIPRAPAYKENVSALRRPNGTSAPQSKSEDSQAHRKTAALKLSNNF